MISIAYLIDSLETPSAGTERQLLMLLEHLDRSRFRPRLFCLRSSPWLERALLPCPLHVLGLDSLVLLRSIKVAWELRQQRGRHQFDILHTLFQESNLIGPVLARAAGIRVTVSGRRNMGYWQTPFHQRMARLLRPWTSHYLANSKAVKDYTTRTEGVDPARISVIYNGLDASRISRDVDLKRAEARADLGLGDEHTLIVSVANLRPVKNLRSLVEAADILSQRHEGLRFLVVGEGPERGKLEEVIARRGLEDRFWLPGSTSDTVCYLAAADIAVQCSLSESFSNALIEYMAAGLPIVASRVGGNEEAISQGQTGLLYSGASASDLAAELERLLEDKDLSLRLGRAAQISAQSRFSVEACIEQTQELYEALVWRGSTGEETS